MADECGTGKQFYSFYNDEENGLEFEFPFSWGNQYSKDYRLWAMWLLWEPQFIAPAIRPKSTTSNEFSILLLQGLGIKFVEKNEDLWFRANREIAYDNSTGIIPSDWHRYQMDAFLSMVTCTEQYRLCSSITDQCTEYQGLLRYDSWLKSPSGYGTLFGANARKLSANDVLNLNSSILLLQSIMKASALPWGVQQRGQSAFQASRYLNNGQQENLRSDQWKFELEYWFMLALARLQLEVMNTVDRPRNLDETRAYNLWATEDYKVILNLCGRIKFRSSDHTSLSAFGLVMILVFSGTLMISSFLGMGLYTIPWTKQWRFVAEWQRDEVLNTLARTNEPVI